MDTKGYILEQLNEIKSLLAKLQLSTQEYLSFEEAANYLKLSKSTLYKHTHSGKISYYKPNGKLCVFSRKELDAFLNKNRVPSNDELNTSSNE